MLNQSLAHLIDRFLLTFPSTFLPNSDPGFDSPMDTLLPSLHSLGSQMRAHYIYWEVDSQGRFLSDTFSNFILRITTGESR